METNIYIYVPWEKKNKKRKRGGKKTPAEERKESNLIVRHVAAADSADDGFINVTSETPFDNPIRRYWRLLNISATRTRSPIPRTCRLERFNYSFSRARLGIIIIGVVVERGRGNGRKGRGGKIGQRLADWGHRGLTKHAPFRFVSTDSSTRPREAAEIRVAPRRVCSKWKIERIERERRERRRERERGTRETFGRKISQLSSVIRRCVVQFSTSTANFRILLFEHPRIEEGRGTDKAIDYKRKRGVQAYPEGAIALLLFRHHHPRNKFTKVRWNWWRKIGRSREIWRERRRKLSEARPKW